MIVLNNTIHFLWLLWDLPAGSIWSNLAASIVCLIVGFFFGRKWIKKANNSIDAKFAAHKEHLEAKLEEHHRSLISGIKNEQA